MGRANAIREYAMGRANVVCEYAMNRTNAIYDTRIGYARYANTLWAARIQYAMRECDMRYANRLRAMSNCKVAFLALKSFLR